MAAVELFILGPLGVYAGNREVTFRAPKERHLLGALILRRPHVVTADELIEELWPGVPPDDPIASLRVLVSRVRRRLRDAGSDVEVRGMETGYAILVGDAQLDSERFLAGVAAADGALSSGDARSAAAAYRSALALWRGEVCADLPLGVTLAGLAADLENHRCAAIERRVEAELACGEHLRLVTELEELVQRFPENDAFARCLMVAMTRCGRQAEALRVAADLRRRLAAARLSVPRSVSELESDILAGRIAIDAQVAGPGRLDPAEIRPASDPTVICAPDLADASEVRSAWPVPASPRTSAPARDPLVGRACELQALHEARRRSLTGQMEVIVIEGDAGTGKTQLIEIAAEQASADGALVLRGDCDTRRLRPYQCLLEALAPMIARLEPDRRQRLAAFDRSARGRQGSMATAAERTHAFARLAAALAEVAQEQPVLLTLDDIQWIDSAAMAALRHIAAALRGSRVAIILASRPAREHWSPEVEVLIRGLSTAQLELGAMSLDDILGLVTELKGNPLSSAERRGARSVWVRSGGNPYLGAEWSRDLLTQDHLGDLAERDPALPFDSASAARALLDLRMSGLGPHARTVLEAAAVLAMDVPIPVLAAVVGDGDLVSAVLEGASRSRLVRVVAGAPARVVFSHALVREALLASVPATRQMFLHDRIASVLEGQPTAAEHLEELAFHGLAAAPLDLARAVRLSANAAMGALARLGFEEAERLYSRCKELVGDGAPVSPGLAAEIACGLAECVSVTAPGAFDEAWAAAFEAAKALRSSDHLARVALMLPSWSDAGITGQADPRFRDAAVDALALVPLERRALRSRLCSAAARQSPSGADRSSLLLEAVSLAEATGEPRALLDALAAVVSVGGPDTDMRAMVRRADDLVAESDETLGGVEASALAALERAHIFAIADRPRLSESIQLARTRADRAARPYFHVLTSWWEVDQLILSGPLDAAEARLAEAVDETLAAAMPTEFAMAMAGVVLGMLRFHQGRLGELESVARTHAEAWAAGDGGWAFAAMAAFAAGHREDAAAIVERLAAQDFAGLALDSVWLPSIGSLGLVAARLGDAAVARRIRELVTPYAGLWGWSYVVTLAPVDYGLGALHLCEGDAQLAVPYLERAAMSAREVGAAVWEAWSHLELAEAHARCGAVELARENRSRALALAQKGGFEGVTQRAETVSWEGMGIGR